MLTPAENKFDVCSTYGTNNMYLIFSTARRLEIIIPSALFLTVPASPQR